MTPRERRRAAMRTEIVELVLTGAAGGHYVAGDGERERIELDAVEFCRVVSRRADGEGVLAQAVPF